MAEPGDPGPQPPLGGTCSQVELARQASPDLVSICLGNNDTLQAVLNGGSYQFRVTPTDDFNFTLHKEELTALQDIRSAGLSDSIPTLFGDLTRKESLNRLGFLSMKGAFDHIADRLKEVPGREPGETKRPDVVVFTLPDTTDVPILMPLRRGAKLKDVLKRTNPAVPEKLPYKVVLFGIDITRDLQEKLELSDAIAVLDPNAPEGDRPSDESYLEGTRVSLQTILKRMGRRLIREIDSVIRPVWFISDLKFFLMTRAARREAIGMELRANWEAGKRIWEKLFKIPYAFREDEVLQPGDIDNIQRTLNTFNQHVQDRARAKGFAVFDLHGLFKQAASPEGLPVQDATGVVVDTVRATLRGGIFSLDGGHAGNYGNRILAGELLTAMRKAARESGRTSFGGIPIHRLRRASRTGLEGAKESDEALKGAQVNP